MAWLRCFVASSLLPLLAACASASGRGEALASATELRRLTAELQQAVQREDFAASQRLANAIDDAASKLTLGAGEPAFEVLDARWGTDTRWADVTDKARSLATPAGLAAWVDDRTWGDPAPRRKKTLVLVYLDHGAVRTSITYEDRAVTVP